MSNVITKNQVKDFLNKKIEQLIQLRENSRIVCNGFIISKVDGQFKVHSTLNKIEKLRAIRSFSDLVSDYKFLNDVLGITNSIQSFNDAEKLISLVYFDLMIYLNCKPAQLASIGLDQFASIETVKGYTFTKAALFANNKNAIIIDQNSTSKEHLELLSMGFRLIDYPKDFEFRKVQQICRDMKECLAEYDVDKCDFTLRIKKLGHLKKKGMYSPDFQMLFIDPRHTYVWRHELGHYYHHLKNITDIDFEEFANNF